MSMQELLSETIEPVRLLKPQNVSNTKINGDAVVAPWRRARQMLVCINGGDMASGDILTFKIEKRRAGTSTWDIQKQPDGSTDVAFPLQKQSGGSGLETRLVSGVPLFGVVDFNRIDTQASPDGKAAYDYDAIRLTAQNAVGQNVVCSATGILGQFYNHPIDSAQYEAINSQIRYTGGNANALPS